MKFLVIIFETYIKKAGIFENEYSRFFLGIQQCPLSLNKSMKWMVLDKFGYKLVILEHSLFSIISIFVAERFIQLVT